MAGFYKRNQGQLIRTLSAIGMALILGGVCMFLYQLMIVAFPNVGQERQMDFAWVAVGQYELVERWPPAGLQTPPPDERYASNRVIDTAVKDEMEAFYNANPQFERNIRVRTLSGVGYARWVHYGVPGIIFIAGAIFIVYLVNKPKFADFLIATEGEMKKVSWSNRSELIGSTTIVIVTVAILGVFIAIADLVITVILDTINVH